MRANLLGVLFLVGCAAFSGAAYAETIKCWTNDEGVRECGSVIPPQYVPKGHEIRNSDGRVVDEIGAQKSPEEIAELLRQREEERKHREIEEQRLAEGKALLDAFPTESDILLAREGELASVEAAIKVAQTQVDFFKRSLTEAENVLTKQQKPNPDLAKHVEGLKQQIVKFESIIVDKQKEQVTIDQKYDEKLQKYREYIEFVQKSRGPAHSDKEGPAAEKK